MGHGPTVPTQNHPWPGAHPSQASPSSSTPSTPPSPSRPIPPDAGQSAARVARAFCRLHHSRLTRLRRHHNQDQHHDDAATTDANADQVPDADKAGEDWQGEWLHCQSDQTWSTAPIARFNSSTAACTTAVTFARQLFGDSSQSGLQGVLSKRTRPARAWHRARGHRIVLVGFCDVH